MYDVSMYSGWASKVIPDMCIYQLTTAVTDPRSTIYYKLIQLQFSLTFIHSDIYILHT